MKDFLQGATYAHISQTLIPHMLVPPQECTPSLSNSPSAATPPFPWASTTGQIRNFQSSIVATGLPPGELTSSAHSLTWRDFLTGLTTTSSIHGPDNPLLHSRSSTHGHSDGSNKNWMWETVQTGQNAGNPQGTGVARVSTQVCCRGLGLGIQQWRTWSLFLFIHINRGNGWPTWSRIMRVDRRVRMV
jgi:hypothetical protein